MTRRTRGTLLFLSIAALLPATVAGQHFPSDAKLIELIQSRMEEGRAIGIVVGVLEADGSTRVVAYGDAGANARPLGERSVFEIGSITKAFTGVLLADMVARGDVTFSDPVAMYLPEGVTMPSGGGNEITLLDLATQHSGLPRLPDNMSPADQANPYADYTVEQMYAFLSGHELRRDPGSEYEYSNFGVGLLGHTLAQAAGGSYEDVVREHILEPLGMDMTGIALGGEMLDWMVEGHNEQGEVVPLWDIPTLAGAGALRSNMEDMLAFLDANVGPAETALERSMRTSHDVREDISPEMSIGLAWHVRHVGDASIVWHNGGTGGFRSFLGFDPNAGVGAVVLTNSAHGADDIGFHLINPEVPLTPAPEPLDDEAVDALYEAAIAWVNLVFDDRFAAAAEQAHPAVAAQLTADALEQAMAQLGPQLGALRSLEPKERSISQGLNLVVLTGVFEAGTCDVQVYMGDDHTVAGFFVRPPGG
jgi:CubicO group peptidase (beta-lactamase class C family)